MMKMRTIRIGNQNIRRENNTKNKIKIKILIGIGEISWTKIIKKRAVVMIIIMIMDIIEFSDLIEN